MTKPFGPPFVFDGRYTSWIHKILKVSDKDTRKDLALCRWLI